LKVNNRIYKGDTDAKRVIRTLRHLSAARALAANKVNKGSVITLAGDDAADVGAIRFLLRWSAPRSWFIDDGRATIRVGGIPVGLVAATSQWPGINIYDGDLTLALAEITTLAPFAFVNLDMCGHPTPYLENVIRISAKRMIKGGVISVNILIVRENDGEPYLRHLIRRYGANSLMELRSSYPQWITDTVERPCQLIWSATYCSHRLKWLTLSYQIEPRCKVERSDHIDLKHDMVAPCLCELETTLRNTGLKKNEIQIVLHRNRTLQKTGKGMI